MKNFLFFIIILSVFNQSIAQRISKETIAGSWKVIDVKIVKEQTPKEAFKMMEIMKNDLMGTYFNFSSEGNFTIDIKKEASGIVKEMEFLNNKDWKFSDPDQLVLIGTPQDNYNHLRMYVKNKSDRFFFAFSDTPIILEMIKE